MKRVITSFLAFALVLCLLASCGAEVVPESSESSSAEALHEETSAAASSGSEESKTASEEENSTVSEAEENSEVLDFSAEFSTDYGASVSVESGEISEPDEEPTKNVPEHTAPDYAAFLKETKPTVLEPLFTVPANCEGGFFYSYVTYGSPTANFVLDTEFILDAQGNLCYLDGKRLINLETGETIFSLEEEPLLRDSGLFLAQTLGGKHYFVSNRGIVVIYDPRAKELTVSETLKNRLSELTSREVTVFGGVVADDCERFIVYVYTADGDFYLTIDGELVPKDELPTGAWMTNGLATKLDVQSARSADEKARLDLNSYLFQGRNESDAFRTDWLSYQDSRYQQPVHIEEYKGIRSCLTYDVAVGTYFFPEVVFARPIHVTDGTFFWMVGYLDHMDVYRMTPGKNAHSATELAELLEAWANDGE